MLDRVTTTEVQTLTEYTALLSLPDGDMAREAAERLRDVAETHVTDDWDAGVWLQWTVTADSDKDAIYALQEIRLRAEMVLPHTPTPASGDPSLFQGTPFIIIKGDIRVIFSEEVYCV